ncbi:unnamed protein product [Clonostachys rhizophaga]|uniref:Uncharacterized protein n=1 Tax=Clonostachys rhizophaga TaxID=160324 RepID=A0A9N9YUL0_9HYPO|nr:unnamed protein product [Clonostachys rhizophaga]
MPRHHDQYANDPYYYDYPPTSHRDYHRSHNHHHGDVIRRPRAQSPPYRRSRSLDHAHRERLRSPPRSRHHHGHRNHSPSPERRPPHHHHRAHHRDHGGSRRPRSSSLSNERLGHVAKAAVDAAAIEAIRQRHQPGTWTGSKGARVATAAVGAAVTDHVIDKDPNKGKRHLVESTLGGLLANRLINGSRDDAKRRESVHRRR